MNEYKTLLYLSWCPRAIGSYEKRSYQTKELSLNPELKDGLIYHLKKECDLVDNKYISDIGKVGFSHRNDGVFLFYIKLKYTCKMQKRDIYNLSSYVCDFIKTFLHHVHFFHHGTRKEESLYLDVKPVEICEDYYEYPSKNFLNSNGFSAEEALSVEEFIYKVVDSDKLISKLEAAKEGAFINSESTLGLDSNTFAVLQLRSGFSSVFNRFFKVRERIRSKSNIVKRTYVFLSIMAVLIALLPWFYVYVEEIIKDTNSIDSYPKPSGALVVFYFVSVVFLIPGAAIGLLSLFNPLFNPLRSYYKKNYNFSINVNKVFSRNYPYVLYFSALVGVFDYQFNNGAFSWFFGFFNGLYEAYSKIIYAAFPDVKYAEWSAEFKSRMVSPIILSDLPSYKESIRRSDVVMFFMMAWFFLTFLWIDFYKKRIKILLLLNNVKGTLIFGSIYSDVVRSIYWDKGYNRFVTSSFSNSIDILETVRRRELLRFSISLVVCSLIVTSVFWVLNVITN